MEQRPAGRATEAISGRHTARLWVLGFSLVISAITLSANGGPTSTATNLPKEDELTEYRALRRMHAKSDRFNHEGWLDAWTEFDGREFRFEVLNERGSEYVRNKVLRTVLQREQEVIAQGNAHRAAFTEENYEFTDSVPDEDGNRYVLMKPKRKEVMLVDGRMVLSPEGSLLRVEGRLAKNPSFWTSLVNVTRRFATIDGVRVPVSTESIAKVKFAGHSRLDIVYDYESINGRPVSQAARLTLASAGRQVLPPQ